MFFTFLTTKNSLRKTFLLKCVRSGAQQAARKRGNFGAKLTHLCGFWLDVSFFSHVKKTSFAILIGRIIFFMCENQSSLLWLARTHLLIKIYNTTFWWVFLSCLVPRRLSLDKNVGAKEGGKESTGETWLRLRLYPSHGPLRFITSRSSTLQKTKRPRRRLISQYVYNKKQIKEEVH